MDGAIGATSELETMLAVRVLTVLTVGGVALHGATTCLRVTSSANGGVDCASAGLTCSRPSRIRLVGHRDRYGIFEEAIVAELAVVLFCKEVAMELGSCSWYGIAELEEYSAFEFREDE